MKDINDKVIIGISKAPEDPNEKKEWVEQMKRIQIAMWVDGKSCCEWCGKVYTSVDDFLLRNPKRGHTENMSFVDDVCYPEYAKKFPLTVKGFMKRK